MVKLKPYLIVFLLLFLLTLFNVGQAQEHIFTKNISKTINVAMRSITIDAEKANISITEAEDENFALDLTFVSKHSDKQIAEKQLSYMHHVINIKNKDAYVRNYILISSGEVLSGTINCEYTLKIPKNKTITITNSLGNIDVENISGNFIIDVKYGNINLTAVEGKTDVDLHIGELWVKNSNLDAGINSKYVSTYLLNCSGTFAINTNMGLLNATINKGIAGLKIESAGTDINLTNKNCVEFNYDLQAEMGKIVVEPCCIPNASKIISDSRQSENKIIKFKYDISPEQPTILIKNKFANTTIQ